MSSRFVPAGTDQASSSTNDEWAKAKSEVESRRNAKPVEPGKQEDGKSLYEVLQANKAAKQDAFEEAAKLRNQFRALDDSEIEFLDSIRESERAKETVVRQETAEQLDLFRKQQSEANRVGVDHGDTAGEDQNNSKTSWTTSKKRRRDKGEELSRTKLLKPSSASKEADATGSAVPAERTPSHALAKITTEPSTTIATEQQSPKTDTKSTGLGLGAYGSDDD